MGPEGCAMESRRSLAKLLGIRGRAAVRWQEAVAGSGVVIGMGKQGRVFASVDDDEDEDERTELDADGNLCAKCSFDPDESEAAVNTWGALFTEQRNRYPMIIGAGVCLLAGLSGSNTVIYYASSVLKEAGVDDPGLLTLVVELTQRPRRGHRAAVHGQVRQAAAAALVVRGHGRVPRRVFNRRFRHAW